MEEDDRPQTTGVRRLNRLSYSKPALKRGREGAPEPAPQPPEEATQVSLASTGSKSRGGRSSKVPGSRNTDQSYE